MLAVKIFRLQIITQVARALCRLDLKGIHQGFDFILFFIGQFDAAFCKDLNAVILMRIVRGGDHHTGRSAHPIDQTSQRRGGQNADMLHITTGIGKAGDQSTHQHILRSSCITADDNLAVDIVFL